VAPDPKEPRVRTRVALPEPANQLAFSNDGRWLASGTATGRVLLWKLSDEGLAEASPLEDAETGRAATLAFAPDGRGLTSGDQDGGLRTWDLPDGRQRPPVPPRRGQVAGLSVSEDGRYLLQVSQDWHAQVWDLQEGRGLSRIEGRWTSGAVAPDGETLYLTREDEGTVVAVDRGTGRHRGQPFERPKANRDGGPTTQRFARLSVSRDGRWVAAGSIEGPLACVWEASTGRLVQTLEGHQDPHPITSVGFSAAADRLLTAGEDGNAIVWDLSDPKRPARALATCTLIDPANADPVPVTAAALAPGQPLRVVTGGIKGQVHLWEPGAAKPLELGQMDYSVLAVTFTPDGRWLAATGADKTVWLWELKPAPRRVRLEPMPHHAEQINALIAWPGGKVIATGSDDTTIRFWSLDAHALLGTLSAEQGTTDWVAYTPDGLFDSSIGGERQVTWRDDRGFLALEQIYDQFHVYKLTDQLRRGVRPQAPERPRRTPPRLSIDLPPAPVQVDPRATLTISLGEPNLSNLRLYQNGVPVQSDEDFGRQAGQQRITTRVRLRHGLNRFHVMAGRPDVTDVEGRSSDVEIRCDASDPPGRVHVLALGVSEYRPRDRALKFADRDARELAEYLYGNGLRAGAPGLKIVLTDRQVDEERITEAFVTIREQVKDRPEDTVVVFLAGHADVLNGRFVMLLSSFPFRDPAPGVRGLAGGGPVDPDTMLPYVALYRNISRLGALQRLVVIDACQAEAIGDDPGVRKIQETIDGGSQKARTAYLLAARRGEPANEAAALEHGLMTYALLKGLGAPKLETLPDLAFLDEQPNADRNRDRVITTEELRSYVSTTVPILAGRFPLLVQRAGIAGPPAGFRPDANLDQMPRIQASDSSFSLIELPKETAAPADGRTEP
jgi:WD40 repeat protein